ncbi:ataxin-1 [Alosa sapidissima]|uniref:ataxin-1 n=1 Tax=Alosa sapidissima TaxID=34773 RepID=UPI001C08B4C8|nr:ataxin-1 [Alosa sapidissima]XP_041963034.1 ataxin-1 [Alosa sapidissima]XP_041963035.1 ataxin-1 [Alosa sapidissima]
MKSSQERGNECLPPKKRELLVLEERALAAVGESQRGENLAWLASVASMASMAPVGGSQGNSSGGNGTVESQSPSHEILSMVTEFHPSFSTPSSSSLSLSSSSSYTFSSSTTSMSRGVGAGVPQSAGQPTVLSTGLAQPAGTVQYAPLPQNLQLIGPYTGYISSQVLPSAASPAGQHPRPQTEAYVTAVVSQSASNGDHHHLHHHHHHPQQHHQQQQQHQQHQPGLGAATLAVSGGVTSPVPQLTQPSTQCIQLDGSSLGVSVSSPTGQLPLHLHPHNATVLTPHTLTLGTSQLLVHYADAPQAKLADGGQSREIYNGEIVETTGVGRHAAAGGVLKVATVPHDNDQRSQAHGMSLAARTQVLLPAEYQDSTGLHTSLMLVPSSAADLQRSLGKDLSGLPRAEKGGICVGKPISRDSRDSRGSTLSLSSLESLASPAPTLSPHALLQTTHASTQEMAAAGIYSATPLPIIGYISGGASQQHGGYHGNLTQHLLISGSPSLLIPVSTGPGPGESEHTARAIVTAPSAVVTVSSSSHQASVAQAPPLATAAHAYVSPIPVATAALPDPGAAALSDGQQNQHMVQVSPQQAHVVQLPPQPAAAAAPVSPSASLPPYFMRGSIIQLADGELKRVEDLKTEDFIQSAEVSGDLKIDSSTVERIDCSQTPDVVVIQFSVGEHKAQVRVEVLVEYPFFVFGQGWSSCSPDKTTQLLELSCAKLSVGDVCISLTLRSVRNGSLRKEQTTEPVGTNSAKPAKVGGPPRDHEAPREGLANGPRLVSQRAPGSSGPGGEPAAGGGEQQQHVRTIQIHQTLVENGRTGEPKVVSAPLESAGAPERPTASRKRRWSAPENREAERLYEETPPTATLPKLAFIPQEVKISIEGRSSTGR